MSQFVSAGALAAGSGTFTETPVPAPATSPDGNLFQYNAELAVPFKEQANTVYWLKIVALDPNHASSTTPGAIQWGWHDRDWGLMDNLAAGPPVPSPGEFNQAPVGTGPIWHFQDDAVSGSVSITLPSSGGLPLLDETNFAQTNYSAGHRRSAEQHRTVLQRLGLRPLYGSRTEHFWAAGDRRRGLALDSPAMPLGQIECKSRGRTLRRIGPLSLGGPIRSWQWPI